MTITRDETDSHNNENPVKVLFFILTRIDGKSKRIDMNKEVINNDELCLHKQKRKSRD